MATAAKFVLQILTFLAYLVPLEVDVTRNITATICEVWSEFNIFCTLVNMAMAAILNFFNPQKLPHTTVDIPTKWIIIWFPNHGYQFPTSKSTWKPNREDFCILAAILDSKWPP